jgi:DNA-directed RNA polymerase subunit K/omega
MNKNICENCDNFMWTYADPETQLIYNGCKVCGYKEEQKDKKFIYKTDYDLDLSQVLNTNIKLSFIIYNNIMSDDEEDTIIFDETQYDNDLISKEDSNYFYENYNIKNNKSSNILSKYEKTKVIFERIQLINSGSKVFIENPEKYNTIYDIVLEELKFNKIPFIIKRNVGNSFEYWKLEDLHVI